MLPRRAARRLKVLESARPIVCSLHAPFAKSAFRNVNTWSKNGLGSFSSSIGSSASLSGKGGKPWNGEASTTPDHLRTLRGLAFEKVYLVKERLLFVPKELHVAVVLFNGNDSLFFGEKGHNCIRLEFGIDGIGMSTMTHGDVANIRGTIFDSWKHDCLGKSVQAVVDVWMDREYDPKDCNCIHFAGALLRGIGLGKESKKLEKLQRRAMFWYSGLEGVKAAKASSSPENSVNIIQLKRLKRELKPAMA